MVHGKKYDRMKRAIDIGVTALLLIVTLPVQAVVAFLVRVKLGRPVVFKQPRPGVEGRIFTLYKFRSMLHVDEAAGRISNEDRLTSFGRKLRASSLDELPSFWNILTGDMSLVGPRPLHESYLERYTSHQARRHEVRPGLTGLAQVKGRNSLSWEEKFDYDVHYVDRRSLLLDLRIVFGTIPTVLRRSGISAEGGAVVPEFMGFDEQGEVCSCE